jgi:hypothetical protein
MAIGAMQNLSEPIELAHRLGGALDPEPAVR